MRIIHVYRVDLRFFARKTHSDTESCTLKECANPCFNRENIAISPTNLCTIDRVYACYIEIDYLQKVALFRLPTGITEGVLHLH